MTSTLSPSQANEPQPLEDTGPEATGSTPQPSPFELPSQKLDDFLKEHHEEIRNLLIENYQPGYDPSKDTRPLPPLKRRPLGAQELVIRATADRLDGPGYASIVGEMGVGKTYAAIGAAAMAKNIRRVIVLVPPHLTHKWKREIEITLPSRMVHAEIVTSITQLERLRRRFGPGSSDTRILFAVMSHWQAKTSHFWRPVQCHSNPVNSPLKPTLPVCPDCGAKVTDEDAIKRLEAPKPKHKLRCDAIRTNGRGGTYVCNGALWTSDNRNPMLLEQLYPPTEHNPCPPTRNRLANPNPGLNRRVALADYIGKHMRGFFDLTIADEMHQFKAKGSARGISAGNIAAATKKALTLTGTLMGGQATTIFYLLYRFSPAFRRTFGFKDTTLWRTRYGFTETTHTWKDEDDSDATTGAQSKRKEQPPKIQELPGITPNALFHIIGHTIFLKLRDVSDDLPPYTEHVSIIPMTDRTAPGDDRSQLSAYQYLEAILTQRLHALLNAGSKRLLSTYLQSLLAYPDACTLGEQPIDPVTLAPVVTIHPLSPDVIYPKEQALLDLVEGERAAGRKVMLYVTHVDRRDITPRLQQILTRKGFRTLVLRSGNPDTEHREAWLDRNSPHCDVLITNPSLVETGLDLIAFPTIIWYEPEYSVFTVRQASRRSWRIGQPLPVKVHHLVYEGCMQTQALKHIALKAQTSLAIEGELPQQGLTEYGSGSHDITMELAKQLLGQLPDDGISVLEAMELSLQQQRQEDQHLVAHDYTLPVIQPAAPNHLPKTTGHPHLEADTSLLEPGQQISLHDFLFPDT